MEFAKSLGALAVIALFLSCAPAASPAPARVDWPMYRGDLARDGHPPSATLDAAGARRLAAVWHGQLPGAIDGTPAIAGGLVIAASMGGHVAAFRQSSGALTWDTSPLGPISSSPDVDGSRVFVSTLTGHVWALDLGSGVRAWDWQAPGVQPALWASPAVDHGVVVIGSASPYGDAPLEPGRMFGLDESSGRLIWSICILPGCAPGDGVWSTPSIDAAGIGYVGVGNPADGVLAFDVATGKPVWQVSLYPDAGRDLDIGASPVLLRSGGREALAVSSTLGLVAVLDARDGSVIWSAGIVEGSSVHGLLATPAYDGSLLFVASASPPTGVIALATGGAVDWKHVTDLPVYSSPAVANGVVIFGTGAVFGDLKAGTVMALSASSGATLWTYDAHSAVRGSPAVAGSLVVIGDHDGDLLAFAPAA
ncbi:MAG TPA: PQQ-binding-like beta-propeller repeat protein [Candidatus Dormibacteraeota bacterium]|nr:PQQ-binding-like beta-propeller repeat protein [Candidatus Dormibacteraeota bacterium]